MSYLQPITTTNATTTVATISPSSVRRVRTDLKTSENLYLTTTFSGPTRSRTSSPINMKLRPHHHQSGNTPPTSSPHSALYLQGRFNAHDKFSDCNSVKSNNATATNTQPYIRNSSRSRSKRIANQSTNIPMATGQTSTTVANARKYIKRSNFILTSAKHVVDDSRILSTSAPHEGSTYLRLCLTIYVHFVFIIF